MNSHLKELLRAESDFVLDNATMDRFLSGGIPRTFETGEVIVNSGDVNDSIFIILSGVARNCYLDGEKEVTEGFSNPGTLMLSYHCFFLGAPSYLRLEACCRVEALEITRAHFNKMVETSHEFTRWFMGQCMGQLYYLERKNKIINGTAEERYLGLVKDRPEILRNVPLKIIASYLNITPQYLSVLRNRLAKM